MIQLPNLSFVLNHIHTFANLLLDGFQVLIEYTYEG